MEKCQQINYLNKAATENMLCLNKKNNKRMVYHYFTLNRHRLIVQVPVCFESFLTEDIFTCASHGLGHISSLTCFQTELF